MASAVITIISQKSSMNAIAEAWRVTSALSAARPLAELPLQIAGSCAAFGWNGVRRSAISAWLIWVFRDNSVITIEMPTLDPMLRIRLKMPAASVRVLGGRVEYAI